MIVRQALPLLTLWCAVPFPTALVGSLVRYHINNMDAASQMGQAVPSVLF